MIVTTSETGRLGEDIAKEYLQNHGYHIIEQNYKTKYAEIDIVATKGSKLVFVEVRTKSDERFGTPEETINYKKKMKLLWNAKAYVAHKQYKGPYRIDALCIVLGESEKPQRISHYENIIS